MTWNKGLFCSSAPDEEPVSANNLNPNAPFDFFGHGQVGAGPVDIDLNELAVDPEDQVNAQQNQDTAPQNLANAEWEPLNLNLNELPEGEDVVMNGGEIVDPVGGEAAGEIILDEAFIEANEQPVIIEEVAEPVEEEPALPLNDLPVGQFVPEIPPVILGLQAPLQFPGNFLVEEFPEDMLMDGEENHEPEENADKQMADQLSDNVQLGFVEVLDNFSVDPGLASYLARNSCSQNAEAVRLWATHFNCASSNQPTVNIPVEWSNFFSKLLLSPTHFN